MSTTYKYKVQSCSVSFFCISHSVCTCFEFEIERVFSLLLQIKQNFFLGVHHKERPVSKTIAKLLDLEKTIQIWCAIVTPLAVKSHEPEQRACEYKNSSPFLTKADNEILLNLLLLYQYYVVLVLHYYYYYCISISIKY